MKCTPMHAQKAAMGSCSPTWFCFAVGLSAFCATLLVLAAALALCGAVAFFIHKLRAGILSTSSIHSPKSNPSSNMA